MCCLIKNQSGNKKLLFLDILQAENISPVRFFFIYKKQHLVSLNHTFRCHYIKVFSFFFKYLFLQYACVESANMKWLFDGEL